MPDFKGMENFHLILAFIVPGLITLYVRSRFVAGRRPTQSEQVLSFLVLSVIYYTLTIPILSQALSDEGSWQSQSFRWFGLTIVGPAFFGLVLGANAQKGWTDWIFDRFKLYLVDIVPTAWDKKFANTPRGGMFVLVTLTDGSTIPGFFGTRSFASSDNAERDLYLEEEWNLEEDGSWTARPQTTGILISSSQIKHVEFFEP